MATVGNVNEILDGHVVLDLECLDRIYLNAYVPTLQVGGQVVTFLNQQRNQPIASPALFQKMGEAFRQAVATFAKRHQIPVIRFGKRDRLIDVIQPYFKAATQPGVVAIGIAQEFQSVLTAYDRTAKKGEPGTGGPHYSFVKEDRRVTVYYFYIADAEFGLGFIKLCAYFPYPGKVWANGHEWAKRQALAEGLAFTELASGFASCADPARLQAICDQLGPADLQAFFDRWIAIIPTPLNTGDQEAGYWWELSMRQVETSRTLVFDAPRRARGFFEALVADNLDLGRPDEVQLTFGRQIRSNTDSPFSTKVVTRGVDVIVNVFYKHSRIKEYSKKAARCASRPCAIRQPTAAASAGYITCLNYRPRLALPIVDCLPFKRAGQGCAVSTALFERVALPSLEEGQRTGALRFGDPRTMALVRALCITLNAVVGFTNRSLRAQVAGLLATSYTSSQMTYDLRRLRRKGLIRRQPRSNTYLLTPDGIRVAIFYTKVYGRLLRPLLAVDHPPALPELRQALRVIDGHVIDAIKRARLPTAA